MILMGAITPWPPYMQRWVTPQKLFNVLKRLRQSGQNDYFTGSLFNNYNNILAIFYQFGHREKTGRVVKWLGTNYASKYTTDYF